MSALAACTIVSKNYLAFARVLARSFLDHEPDGRFFVLLVDRVDGFFEPAAEDFVTVEVEELDNIPERRELLFKYTLLECNTAVKPYFLAHLFERFELDRLVYFDPDILITGSLDELTTRLGRHAIVLTPHLTHPIDDGHHPDELAILQSGAYNLGFIGLRRGELVDRLLRWWQERLYERCVVRIRQGLFVDQKWMDLVPGLFPDVDVVTEPGWNVAYWNLHGRAVTVADDGGAATVNGRPLVFFHFSGIEPDSLVHVSKHQDRYRLSDLGDAAILYRQYRDLLLAAGFAEARPWPYAFGRFSNGAAIPDLGRHLFHAMSPAARRRFGDPFDAEAEGSFFAWLNAPADDDSPLTRLVAEMHASRADLRRAFPDPGGADWVDFSSWLADFGRFESRLDKAFLTTVEAQHRANLTTAAGLERRFKNRVKRAAGRLVDERVKRRIKRWLGPHRTQAVKRRLGRAASATEDREVAPQPLSGPPSRPYRALQEPGINLVGYLEAETGMGEAARSLARALAAAGIPHTLHAIDLNVVARQDDASFAGVTSDFRHGINLFVVNADQVPAVREHLGVEVFAGRYNVGLWLWEMERFPERWRAAFEPLDEVWTPSTFCVDAISELAPLPVRRVPLPVPQPEEASLPREHFGLGAGTFVVLYIFNYLSYFERKNPLAAIRAFRRAFPSSQVAAGTARLVLKTSQSDFAADEHGVVLAEIGGHDDVLVLDGYYSRAELASLTAAADAYLSLHRAEGYGLTLAEAMARGKPVIATDYSGNRDFLDAGNGLPVRYDLVELEADAGPYPRGARWAAPDLGHAAAQLRRAFAGGEEIEALTTRARRDIAERLGVDAVGQILERRYLEILEQLRRRLPPDPGPPR